MAEIAVIDSGSGNLRSVANALRRAARDTGLGDEVTITASPDLVARADRIVLPGQGAFGAVKAGLEAVPGLCDALIEAVTIRARPMLGICVGMQLMVERGLERGHHAGLGWLKGEVRRLSPRDETLKIPHMGWNELHLRAPHPVLDGLGDHPHAYFVHSYGVDLGGIDAPLLAVTDYGGPITAAIGRDSFIGVQFHPEKSQAVGLNLLGRFLRWAP